MKFDEFICLLGNMQDTPKQITNKSILKWFSGDFDRYYYVFEIGEDLRAEIVDGLKNLWFGLFTWERNTVTGEKIWHSIIKDKDNRLTYDELVNSLACANIKIDEPNMLGHNVLRKQIKTIDIPDEFFQSTGYDSDCEITIKRKYDKLGNVMRWMASYNQEDYDTITKYNYKTAHADDSMDLVNRYPDGTVITAGGDLCYYSHDKDGNVCKSGYCGDQYPKSTPFISIICDYADVHWTDEVYVVSYYAGLQGLLAITVYDVENKNPLFSFTALEMYGDWRAR